MSNKLKPDMLRTTSPDYKSLKKIPRQPIYFILDNIMDTYNVGTIFRLADAVGVKKIYLCGITETPPNIKVKKASINTWQWVEWEYTKDTPAAIAALRREVPEISIIGVEQRKDSLPFHRASYHLPLALVVGHETNGVSQAVLEQCDTIVEIPQFGINTSLNVIVALSIVAYRALESNGQLSISQDK